MKIVKLILKNKYKLLISILLCFLMLVGLFCLADKQINNETTGLVFNDLINIPHNRVGLLLGTSKTTSRGLLNKYFLNRIEAAAELYKAGKIEYLVASGDNSKKIYNEPLDMKNALIEAGVPSEKIYLDYAGFRTNDSVIRMNKIFGQESFTIISQEFHNRRAIYIAKHYGLNTIGYNAKDVNLLVSLRVNLREKLSRVNVFLDLLINRQPKFLGERVEIK